MTLAQYHAEIALTQQQYEDGLITLLEKHNHDWLMSLRYASQQIPRASLSEG